MWNVAAVWAAAMFFVYGTGCVGYAIGKDSQEALGIGLCQMMTGFIFLLAAYTRQGY